MKKIFLLIFCLLPFMLFAQSAMDYFHTAANFYVNANKKSAQKTIKEGIQKFPDDKTLKTLAGKIEGLPDPEDDKNPPPQQNKDNSDEQNKDNQQNKQDNQNKQDQQQQQQQKQQQQKQDKRQLDALQQNERQTQKKVAEEEMKKGGKAKQEKDW
ncbi:MAG: hypothetical protein FWF70_04800 [Bacteroidetes bacterium]|nr:hypothetical protein [Bacteroidota bacterium]MCL1968788.1 hypothetical protein [Bacteroidota bacterium]